MSTALRRYRDQDSNVLNLGKSAQERVQEIPGPRYKYPFDPGRIRAGRKAGEFLDLRKSSDFARSGGGRLRIRSMGVRCRWGFGLFQATSVEGKLRCEGGDLAAGTLFDS